MGTEIGINDQINFLDKFVQSMRYCDRKLLAYSLRNALNYNILNSTCPEIFIENDIDVITIEKAISRLKSSYNENNNSTSCNFVVIELLLCLKYLRVKEKIKILYFWLKSTSVDFRLNDNIIHVHSEKDQKELQTLIGFSSFNAILEEKEKEVQKFIELNILRE